MGHDAWMRLALEVAAQAGDDVPVGAVVVREGEVIASAHNRREKDNAPFAHAELLAMEQAARALGTRRLTGCTLYVTLEPCPMCAGAIVQARVGRLVYGAPNPAQGCAGSLYRIPEDPAFPHFCPCDGGVLAGECAALLEAFFRRQRGRSDRG